MAKTAKETKPTHTVVSDFRDKSDINIAYTKGQDVSDLEEERLEELMAAGLVKKED